MPNLPDFPLRTRLAMEKEVSGVYITGHPLDDYRDILAELPFSTADLEGLEEREDGGMLLDGRAVDMGGILTEVKGKATKKGAYMGFVTLEDLTGQIECLVFPKVYERYQGMMVADDLVVLCGKLSIREEESPKLLVDRVVPLEEWKSQPAERPAPKAAPQPHRQPAPQLTDAQAAQQAKRKLFIKLERPMMDRVTTLLSLHPGSVPVYLHIPEEKITLLAPRLNWCDATEDCLKRLRTFLGEENVKLTEAK